MEYRRTYSNYTFGTNHTAEWITSEPARAKHNAFKQVATSPISQNYTSTSRYYPNKRHCRTG